MIIYLSAMYIFHLISDYQFFISLGCIFLSTIYYQPFYYLSILSYLSIYLSIHYLCIHSPICLYIKSTCPYLPDNHYIYDTYYNI